MPAEKTATILKIPTLFTEADIPVVIDDVTLAYHIHTALASMWYAISQPDDQCHRFILRSGKGKERIIHAPEKRMSWISNQLLCHFIAPLQEKLGPHVTAYRSGRGIASAVKQHIPYCEICEAHGPGPAPSHAECPRDGTSIHMDLKDFFHTNRRSWVRKYFKRLGYTHTVASYIASLCTCTIRKDLVAVPQGYPSSGALCNLIAANRLDPLILSYLEELNSKPRFSGAYKWVYTRYSDDLALTCGRSLARREIKEILRDLARLIRSAGYTVNPKKTRWTHRGWRKHLLGANMHQRTNPDPRLYRKIRAILHNCQRDGFERQAEIATGLEIPDLKTWLLGQINWITQLNPAKGAKLKDAYLQIFPANTEVEHAAV